MAVRVFSILSLVWYVVYFVFGVVMGYFVVFVFGVGCFLIRYECRMVSIPPWVLDIFYFVMSVGCSISQ